MNKNYNNLYVKIWKLAVCHTINPNSKTSGPFKHPLPYYWEQENHWTYYDLFQVNIVSDPSCRCGANREESYHFFFDCSHYANMRYKLFHNLSWLPNDCATDLKLLTSGNPILSNEQNKIICKHVFECITRSERFLV
jgi:uncharacterized cysteine cluster protein YcgN (CxxCxxCC family)